MPFMDFCDQWYKVEEIEKEYSNAAEVQSCICSRGRRSRESIFFKGRRFKVDVGKYLIEKHGSDTI